MKTSRPTKVFRLNYWNSDPELAAQFAILGKPSEIRISSSDKTFISIRDKGITLSPGTGNSVNIQGLSQGIVYAGMVGDLPFPMSLLPSTAVTPLPKQIIKPPLAGIMGLLQDISSFTSSLTVMVA
jgi:hypothetical protein